MQGPLSGQTSQNGTVYYVMANDRMSLSAAPDGVARFERFLDSLRSCDRPHKPHHIQRLTPPGPTDTRMDPLAAP